MDPPRKKRRSRDGTYYCERCRAKVSHNSFYSWHNKALCEENRGNLEAVDVEQLVPPDNILSPRNDVGHDNDDMTRGGDHDEETHSPPIHDVDGEYSDGCHSRAQDAENNIINRLLPLAEDQNAPIWHGAQVAEQHLDQQFDLDVTPELLDFSTELPEEDFDPLEALFLQEDYMDSVLEDMQGGNDSAGEGEKKVFPNIAHASDIRVKEAALYELRKKMENKLTDEAFSERLRSMKHYLDLTHPGNNFPSSLNTCKRVVGVEDVWEYSVHYCPNHHRLFDQLPRKEWEKHCEQVCGVNGCGEIRFQSRLTKKGRIYLPRAYFLYFGVGKAIKSA